ncbi:hypothetical protein AJ79_03398 [Helicocarpus griseus UAMH5409]|uniref:DNA-directed RNA polymerase III subunit RPC9 n=1 Tax=Helicocarpus griseus UAMH5409 TaxID=1447875 RepID=A0A2B7XXS3_9EURO|nr:hypothetical protein AJ79_03398 [Helicocarpus griseus UAMH5409]
MKILEPQSAILTNAEVLAHFTLNAPRRPPISKNLTPSPDLRDHNTVVKEFHNFVSRLSPHLLTYPSFEPPKPIDDNVNTTQLQSQPTPLDTALRDIIAGLRRFRLTKAEVITIVNLGVGLDTPGASGEKGEGEGTGESMEVDGEGGEDGEADYGALALLDTVIEDREERLTDADVADILKVIRETLGRGKGGEAEGVGEGQAGEGV